MRACVRIYGNIIPHVSISHASVCKVGSPGARLLATLNERANIALAKGLDTGDMREFEYLFEKGRELTMSRSSGVVSQSRDVVTPSHESAPQCVNSHEARAVPRAAIAIAAVAKQWVDTKDDDRMNRQRGTYRTFQWDIDKTTDISEFQLQLHSKVTNVGSRAYYINGLRQFLSLFETGGASLQEVFEQLADSELMPQVLSLAILKPDVPWTSKMMSAVHRVCQFFRSRATKRGNMHLANKMSLLIDDSVEPRLESCSKAKKEALVERDEEDYEWLSRLNVDALRSAVCDMMKDLASAAHAWKTDKPGPWKQCATTCMTGIVFMSQCNSRPGPWRFLTTDTIRDMQDKGKDYWTAVKGHKQLSVRGAHGAYMSPGCLEAAETYIGMGTRDDNNFWLYKFPKLDAWLKDACAMYLPGYPLMSPTSMRQFWETVMHHDTGEISEKIVQAQAAMNNALDHEDGCAKTHYVKGKAVKVARDSKACTIGYYGELIPSPEECASEEFLVANAQVLQAKFAALLDARQLNGNDAASAYREEECEEQGGCDAEEHDDCDAEQECGHEEQWDIEDDLDSGNLRAAIHAECGVRQLRQPIACVDASRPAKRHKKGDAAMGGDAFDDKSDANDDNLVVASVQSFVEELRVFFSSMNGRKERMDSYYVTSENLDGSKSRI